MKDNREKMRGQVLVGVLLLLVILSVLTPLMVLYTQREALWTKKQNRSTTAFHLAESGIEKGYLALTLSTQTWTGLQNGIPIPNYEFDKSYHDIPGGSYTISITSGPQVQQATVISIGVDNAHKEVRTLQAVYANSPLGGTAVYGGNGVNVSGNNLTVEWGSVMSPQDITPNGANHPSYWSSGNIVGLDPNGPTPPNCDSPNCWWWHSYYVGLPPAPVIDFSFYKSSAQALGAGPCGSYYVNGNKSGSCSDKNGRPYYVEGNWTSFDGPIWGTVVVMGNLTTPNGAMSGQNVTASLPQQAWKQYCNDWSYYKTTYEPANPYPVCPGLYSSYVSPSTVTYAISPVVRGLLYVGGDFTGPNGGGNTDMVYGVIYVKGTVNLNSNSHVKVYYDAGVSNTMQVTKIILSRLSWKDIIYAWPSGLAY